MIAERVREAARETGLLAPGQGVVVLLSGGRDSVCLLDVAVALCGPGAVSALHVNYGLRASAGADEAACRTLCEALGVPLAVERPVRPGFRGGSGDPAGRGGNMQAWARGVRYEAAGALAAERDADIAAGHTATDQVETILYRLASSPSRRALLGMRPRDGRIVRPLLGISREETGDYCRARGLAWCEDETNETGRYARGRVRNGLVPALRAVHPAAEANVLAVAETLRAEAAVLDELVAGVLAGGSAVRLATLRELPRPLARLVVQRMADEAAGRPAPGTARRLDDLLALRDAGTAAIDLPHGVRALAERGTLSFRPRL